LQRGQIEQKWEAIEGLAAEAKQHKDGIARLEAEVARLRADLADAPEESTQAGPPEELQTLRNKLLELNTQVGPTHHADCLWMRSWNSAGSLLYLSIHMYI
jgi:chromosome segregation ATPase